MALRKSPLRGSALTGREIGHCQRRAIGTPAFFAAKGMPQTPADLVARQGIIYEQRLGGATWTFRQGIAKTSVTEWQGRRGPRLRPLLSSLATIANTSQHFVALG